MYKTISTTLVLLFLTGCSTTYQVRITEYSASTLFRGAGIVVSENGQPQADTRIYIEYVGENNTIIVETQYEPE